MSRIRFDLKDIPLRKMPKHGFIGINGNLCVCRHPHRHTMFWIEVQWWSVPCALIAFANIVYISWGPVWKSMKTFHRIFLGVFAFVFMGLFYPDHAGAKEVFYGQRVQTTVQNKETWAWQVDFFEGSKILKIYDANDHKTQNAPLFSADISKCIFCSGKDDNCLEDGIDILTVTKHPDPFVQVICHVGAHAQTLMIFDPQQDSQSPVFQRTGLYWIKSVQGKNDLAISYDKRGVGLKCLDQSLSVGGICERSENWP